MRPRLPLTAIALLATLPIPIACADDTASQTLYKTALPSIMTLDVTKADGEYIGTGFLAIKNGIAVTAWHVVKGAKSVTAKFANGEEDEVTGIIDKDEKADVALIRVKEYGFPLLSLNMGADPDVGAHAYAIGAPHSLDFSLSDGIISQIRELDGVKNLQFTCPISPGNSGGPLIADDGSVIGVVDSTMIDLQNVNFAIPIRKVLALDSTLPTQPWDAVKTTASPSGDTEEDEAIADGLAAYVDGLAEYQVEDVHFLNDDSDLVTDKRFFQCEIAINDASTKLQGISNADPDDAGLINNLIGRLSKEVEMLDFLVKTIQRDRGARTGWPDQETQSLYQAAVVLNASISTPFDALQKWESNGYFSTRFTPAQVKLITTAIAPTNYVIGGTAFLDSPNCIYAIKRGMVCSTLKLREGDILQKINDSAAGCLEDLNAAVKANPGKQIKLLVLRYGKPKELNPKVPDDLPTGPFDYERK